MGYGRAARATRRRSPGPCGAATQTAACARIAALVRAPLLRASAQRRGGGVGDTTSDTERRVRRCATAPTHGGVRLGRASRFLETPPTPATATQEGSRLARMGLTSGIGSVHDGVRAASLR